MNAGPLSLLAELTYRCNLQCPYCYNPLDARAFSAELDAQKWCDVIDQAAALGVLQLHLSGGEPTLRPAECQALVRRARARGLYTNLITQGTFLGAGLLDELIEAGLDHVQISLQSAHAQSADLVAGARVHDKKLAALALATARPIALTVNCVIHRYNIDGVADVIALAERFGVRRLELANAQFYGWALRNRAALLPTRAQVEAATAVVRAARQRLAGKMEITYVACDYYEEFPKPCMGGWGRRFLTVTPDGRVLPCPAASAVRSLVFENVRVRSLADIWRSSDAFQAFRGTGWMPEPCRSCERRELDFGGCRCQAFLLTGDASLTDPACSKSPHHFLVEQAATQPRTSFVPRRL